MRTVPPAPAVPARDASGSSRRTSSSGTPSCGGEPARRPGEVDGLRGLRARAWSTVSSHIITFAHVVARLECGPAAPG